MVFTVNYLQKEMVSIIIAYFSNTDNLEKCLESVLAQTYKNKEVVVINNSSRRPAENLLRKKFSMVKFIEPEENLLYAAAQNLGINKSQGDFLMFLNDDVILENNFISRLVQGIKDSEQTGMVCGKILRMDKVTVDSAGQFLGKDRRPIERGWQKRDCGQYNQASYIFSPGGVAPLYRRETLEEVAVNGEYFDEDFKFFYEDLDLAWRANRFGWRCFYSPLALAYHQRGASTQTDKPKINFFQKYYFSCLPENLQFHLVKNRYLNMIKNDSIGLFLINLPAVLLYETKLWGYILLFRRRLITSIIKDRCLFWKAWGKRRIIKEKLEKGRFYGKIPY